MKQNLFLKFVHLFLIGFLLISCSTTDEHADGDAMDGDVTDGDEPDGDDEPDLDDVPDGDDAPDGDEPPDGDKVLDGDMDNRHSAEISGLLKAPASAAGFTSYFELYDEAYVPMSSIAISIVTVNPPSEIVGDEALYPFAFNFLASGTYWIRGAIDITGDGEYILEDGEYGITQGEPFTLIPGQVIDDAVIHWAYPADGDIDMDDDMDFAEMEFIEEEWWFMECAGDEGNDVGVGKFCTEGGGECAPGQICLADDIPGEIPGEICTIQRCLDGDVYCGNDASCNIYAFICIPDRCMPPPCEGDAGNELGVGKLCTLGGGECADMGGDVDAVDADGETTVELTCALDVDPTAPNICVILDCTGGDCGSMASCDEVEPEFFVCLPDDCINN